MSEDALCYQFLAEAWKLPPKEPAWRWCERNIILDHTSPFPGPYRTEYTPFVRFALDECQRDRNKRVVIMCSAQSTKTQTIMNLVAWAICNDPGEMFWVMASSDTAKEFAKTRLLPLLNRIEVLKPLLPTDRTEKNIMLMMFATMNLMFRGTNSKEKLQSTPVRWLILDEVRNYTKGALEMVQKRVTAWWNARTIMISTPGNKHDEIHKAWQEGNQLFFHFKCPACGHSQPFRFSTKASIMFPESRECGGLVWEANETTKPKGTWNFAELRKTVRYQCENRDCKQLFNEHDRYNLLSSITPVERNPLAQRTHISMSWNCLYVPWIEWADMVVEFLIADMAWRRGNTEPLKSFMTERLCEPWEIRGERPKDSELRRQCGVNYGDPYERGQLWTTEEETAQIVTVDCQASQGGFLKWLRRQWRRNGDSRLIDYGVCLDFDELRSLQTDVWKIPSSWIYLDSGYKTSQVYAACLLWGWGCLKGDDREAFITYVDRRPHRFPYKVSMVDPSLGKKEMGRQEIPLIHWSNPTYKDRLLLHIALGRGPVWQLPDDVSNDYLAEITANERRMEEDTRGIITHHWHKTGTDDWLDCFDSDTEVLTRENGWMTMEEATRPSFIGSVATVNLITDTLEYQYPTRKIRKRYQGEMVEVDGNHLSIKVTPNHRMVIERIKRRDGQSVYESDIVLAKNLDKFHRIKTNTGWNGETSRLLLPRMRKSPKVRIERELAARFIGWFVSEGHSTTRGKVGGRQIGISQKPGWKQDRIRSILDRLPWGFYIHTRQFVSTNSQVCDFVSECGRGAANKMVPQWLKDSDRFIIRAFLEEATLGDGWRDKSGVSTIATISRQLADDLTELAIKAGFRPSVITVPPKPYCIHGKSGTNCRTQYWVRLGKSPRKYLCDGKRRSIIKRVQFDGTVFCLSVPNGALVLRRRGKSFVAGNCELQQLVIADMGGITVAGDVPSLESSESKKSPS